MLEILLPFGLPPDELARDLLRSLQAPALSQLLALASEGDSQGQDGFQPRLPHERWLDAALGPLAALPPDICFAVPETMQRAPAEFADGIWFMLYPVHLHIARDHLVLTDQRQLPLAEEESCTLFASAAELFGEAGLQLVYASARCWLLRFDAWHDLQTCSLDAACGHNVEIWMPKGTETRAWRKLQNEVQMRWFEDPVNLARQERGLPVVNSLWLCRVPPPGPQAPARAGKTLLHADTGHAAAGKCAALPAPGKLSAHILYGDTLIGPALASDWAAWLDAFADLDRTWFAPLLQDKSVWPLELCLTNGRSLRRFTCKRWAHLAFWRKTGHLRLLP